MLRYWMLLLLVLCGMVQAEVAQPPNVVLIISDDQAWTDYGFMGHEAIRTPHLDQLAAGGTVFTRGYVPGSLCRCSLATLVTGLYPHQHAITSNDPPKGVDRHLMLRHIEAAKTLPALLATRGYVSMQAGKWWEGNYRLGGFTHGMTHGDPTRGGRHGDEGLKIGRAGMEPVLQFIDEAGEKPFFLWYAPLLPHEPHDPPEEILARYRAPGRSEHVARYWAMCEWFDTTIGALVAHIEARGLRENTLILYVADNGWIQQQDGKGYAPRSKRSPYDGGLRTPILLNWPGKIPARRDEQTPVLSLDLVPTVLGACGVPVPAAMPGIDLRPLCAGAPSPRALIFGEVFTHTAVDITKPERNLLYRWSLEGDWKLIVPRDAALPVELFDVTRDPFEQENLAEREPARVEAMRTQIDAWWNPPLGEATPTDAE